VTERTSAYESTGDRDVSGWRPAPDVPVASMHLRRVHGVGIARAVTSMAVDRVTLARTPGLRFWKLLGTGSGSTFTPRDADPTRWGLFAVWDSEDALRRFEDTSSTAGRWRDLADETWSSTLLPLTWKGRWSGHDPFDGAVAGALVPGRRIAAVTRARVKASQWRSFGAATPPVAAAVNGTPGLRYTVGIGEAPIGLQGTFSVWDSTEALRTFAYESPAHRAVMERTTTDRWYAEDLFARFAVLSTRGTIDGREV
jgi:heme-degrading monooxygenase HmoA